MAEISKEAEVQCFICKKMLKEKASDKWVYHRSIPDPFKVVCRRHDGVEEWYNRLVKEASSRLAQALSKEKV